MPPLCKKCSIFNLIYKWNAEKKMLLFKFLFLKWRSGVGDVTATEFIGLSLNKFVNLYCIKRLLKYHNKHKRILLSASFCNLQLPYLFARMIVRYPFHSWRQCWEHVQKPVWGICSSKFAFRGTCALQKPSPKNLFHSTSIGGLIKMTLSIFRIRFLHDCISCVLLGARSKWAN